MSRELSARQARRIALAAQGLADPRPAGAAGRAQLRGLAGRLGAIQIDSVNVLVRTHYLPAFSRFGAYPLDALEKEAWGRRPGLFEYWGHEASLMPVAMHPLFRWRMARAEAGAMWSSLARFGRERRDYIDVVLAEIERRGPVTGGDFSDGPRSTENWGWNWSNGKRALEWLFWSGLIAVKTRRRFERVYDLTERVIPRAVLDLPTPDEAEAQRGLIMVAARAMGVATEGDLRDYFRLPVEGFRDRVTELVEAGQLEPVAVEGWRQQAYLVPDARIPRQAKAAALLSPFDNLIWRRERAERLFDARVRIEIYTPAHKRSHGYYVLPFLQGDQITARVDLKADRQAGRLLVQAAHLEPGARAEVAASALAEELKAMASWLALGDVEVKRKGELSSALAAALS